ncbi:MAG: WYL domain-containing protein [Muribaculaceae bacterium]|nr:WYL domain-containing protein [Muribaculaceae bacterium]
MSKDLFSRYVWIIDTIRRHGRITRHELNRLWMLAPFSEGRPLARRSFFNYREGIQQVFDIDIKCDSSTFEYFIEEHDEYDKSVTNWVLNSTSVSNMLSASRDISNRIFLEQIPSARLYLDQIVDAIRRNVRLRFDYSPYYRSQTTTGILLDPYFLKIFRQRWYITGMNIVDGKIKTYALDRMSTVNVTTDSFVLPDDFDAESFSRDAFGIIFTQGEVHEIVLRADTRQAKYLRTLPLHPSQQEMLHDTFSDFHYRLRITPDLVREILSFGASVTVISPPQLRVMVKDALKNALDNYTEP